MPGHAAANGVCEQSLQGLSLDLSRLLPEEVDKARAAQHTLSQPTPPNSRGLSPSENSSTEHQRTLAHQKTQGPLSDCHLLSHIDSEVVPDLCPRVHLRDLAAV